MAMLTRAKAIALLPILTAFAHGAPLEREYTTGAWKEYEENEGPDFSLPITSYRLKAPEKWVNLFKNAAKASGGAVVASRIYGSEREAQQHKNEFAGHIFLMSIRLDD